MEYLYNPNLSTRKTQIQLIPVSEYENEETGKTFLGKVAYNKMTKFA